MKKEARLDKWLWAARIFKTRTIAANACKMGRVKIGESVVKASHNVKVGDIIKLKDLYFEGGRAVLLRKSEKQLEKLLNELRTNPNFKFEIQGHVCCIDTDYFRDAVDEDTGISNLSEARAKAIFAYLKANGIPEERMSYKGYGRDFPLEGEKERNNKRVEICIKEIY